MPVELRQVRDGLEAEVGSLTDKQFEALVRGFGSRHGRMPRTFGEAVEGYCILAKLAWGADGYGEAILPVGLPREA